MAGLSKCPGELSNFGAILGGTEALERLRQLVWIVIS